MPFSCEGNPMNRWDSSLRLGNHWTLSGLLKSCLLDFHFARVRTCISQHRQSAMWVRCADHTLILGQSMNVCHGHGTDVLRVRFMVHSAEMARMIGSSLCNDSATEFLGMCWICELFVTCTVRITLSYYACNMPISNQ